MPHPDLDHSASASHLRGEPCIEALRIVAAVMVMALHYSHLVMPSAGSLGFASTGVDLFFVLSGFVFAPYMLGRPFAYVPHLVRRAFRLFPLYWTALAIYFVLRLPAENAGEHLLSHIFLFQTTSSLETAFFYNPAFWSLPPEAEYYLLLPLLAAAVRRFGLKNVIVFAVGLRCILVAMADPASQDVTPRAIATVHLPGLLSEFMLGTAAYVWSKSGLRGRWASPAGLALLVLLAIVFRSCLGDGASYRSPEISTWLGGMFGLLAAFAYALVCCGLVAWGFEFKPPVSRAFLLAGSLSYGVYLLHNAAPALLTRIFAGFQGWVLVFAAAATTLLVSWALHRLVERPLREYGRHLSRNIRVSDAV